MNTLENIALRNILEKTKVYVVSETNEYVTDDVKGVALNYRDASKFMKMLFYEELMECIDCRSKDDVGSVMECITEDTVFLSKMDQETKDIFEIECSYWKMKICDKSFEIDKTHIYLPGLMKKQISDFYRLIVRHLENGDYDG